MGNGQLTTDATDNLYWNDSKINSQSVFSTIISPIFVSSIYMGNGQLTTDATDNLYWNDSQINSQYGFVTLASGRSVTTTDANITTSSIILVTPYGDLGFGNTFWVTLGSGTWDITIGSALAVPVDFSYHILKY